MKNLSYSEYLNKVYGCFLGKTVVGTLGAPFEGIKMPMELPFERSMIDAMLPNDDLDLQVLWLDVAEKYGKNFTSYDLLRRFVENCDYSPGEYAVMRKNYMRGIYPPLSGKFCNDFYINGMGCPIRSEIWACLAPGDPEKAAEYASRDGVLDHSGDSVSAEKFFAALESEAFFESGLSKLISIGLEFVPKDSRFYGLVTDTLELCAKYDDIKLILRKILKKYGHPDCTNLYQNIGITLLSLLKGNLDIIKTGMDALNCGFDTDCTCATAGAVIGVIRGAQSLIDEYSLGDVKYVLGVRSDRRSDSVKDLAEDIALLGAQWCPDVISGANDKAEAQRNISAGVFELSQYPLRISAEYENDDPVFYPGKPCEVKIKFENISQATVNAEVSVSGAGISDSFSLSVTPHECKYKEITVSCDPKEKNIYDKNLITVSADICGKPQVFTFGAVGATPWKAIGPIWRTDPICTTELLRKSDLKYWNIISSVKYDGDMTDVVRRFHLNFAADTDTEYMTFDECFAPFDENANTKYEESVFYQREDSFRMDDICSFYGPSVIYLARELISPEDMTVCAQIGHSSPFSLMINGELVARRDGCDTWNAENVHIQNIKLKKGINRILFRLTRVNADAKYNLIFSKEPTCSEHYVCFGSVLPEHFGK